MVRAVAVRARILALATLLVLIGGIGMPPSQASAEWTGYWTWDWATRMWYWTWVWVSSGGWGVG